MVAAPCPFCGAKGHVRCESRKRQVWRTGFGDVVEYRTYHIRRTACNARGGTVGGLVGNEQKTVIIYGEETLLHTDGYYERLALEKWNRRAGNGNG